MLVFLKPTFLYDNEKQQYKEFGTGENQTIFTLPAVAIVLAIIIAIIAMSFKIKSIISSNKNNSDGANYKFIPVPVYYQQPMVQVPFNQMNPAMSQQLTQQMQKMSQPLPMQQMVNQSMMPITQPINVNQSGGQYMVTPEMFLNAF